MTKFCPAQEIASKLEVLADIHENDLIYRFLFEHADIGPDKAADHYFNDGRQSSLQLHNIVEHETAIDTSRRWSMLEFASGYGCLTRHFNQVMPQADVKSCDIHEEAVRFIQNTLHVEATVSVSNPDSLNLGQQYDIVFALSFFTHMPIGSWSRWLAALFRQTRPGGSFIFTTHGEVTRNKIYHDEIQLDDNGFWFTPSSEQTDISTDEYGTTITSIEFVTRQIFKHLRAPIALISPGFWWKHQDLYVVTRP